MDRQRLVTQLREHGLGRVAQRLGAMAEDCLRLVSEPLGDDDIAVGQSKLGGSPDLPVDLPWPTWNEVPLAFVGQIATDGLGGFACASALPGNTVLSFFYHPDQATWGFDPKDRGSWRVLSFASKQPLQRRHSPLLSYRSCALSVIEVVRLPDPASQLVQGLALTAEEEEGYSDFYGLDDDYEHQLLGHPKIIQNDMTLECQLASNGIYCGTPEAYQDKRVIELAPGAADWRLLLQVSSDDKADMMWGDVGCLYFWITKVALANHDFGGVWMILQCH
jgi:uncharacterized protein YwqG